MKEKYIQLISKRIEKLDAEDFDLEAWKDSTISVIERIFGEEDSVIKRISDLKIDYSSWALRDATSTYNPAETCKKKGREILNTLIEEIDLLGVRQDAPDLKELLEKNLSQTQVTKINEALESGKTKELEKILKSEKKESLSRLVADLIHAY
jgi:hypothetical protein